jgi:5,5'-dehydrodivanillate O-demethylase
MLTKEQNDRFTQVGPGTPCGELMRRYWHPVAALSQMNDRYVMAVRLLGEDLVLYKDRAGTIGLVDPLCPHRRMNLAYGIPEDPGIRCPYHGWRFDETGQCIEQPYEETEDPEAHYKDKINIKAYPTQIAAGVIFAYLGPQPAPLLPRWDIYFQGGMMRHLAMAVLPCNWLQCQENSLDPVHVEWLHGHFANFIAEMRGQEMYFRGTPRQHAKIGFDRFEYGIYKRHGYVGVANYDEDPNWAVGHPIIFPYYLRQSGDGMDPTGKDSSGPQVQIRVPIDDTHTAHWWVLCHPLQEGEAPQKDEEVPFFVPPVPVLEKDGRAQWHLFESNPEQDMVAWITQGPVADRTEEHLGRSDKGIILFRRMIEENIRLVEEGKDPMNVFRDPEKNVYLGMRTEGSMRRPNQAPRGRGDGQPQQPRGQAEMFGFRSRTGMERKMADQAAGVTPEYVQEAAANRPQATGTTAI